jgi:RNA polymerase sigma-70 factor (ECF subfamily)
MPPALDHIAEVETPPTAQAAPKVEAQRSRPDPDADALCIRDVLAGQRERFSELIERYQHAVLSVVRGYVRDSHAAEDVAQDIFVLAFTSLNQVRDPKAFFPWLLQVARHHAVKVGKGATERPTVPLSGSEVAVDKGSIDDSKVSAVLAAIEQLPEPYRHTLLLKYEANLSCKEIARRDGVSVGTITSRLTRAMAELRLALTGNKG